MVCCRTDKELSGFLNESLYSYLTPCDEAFRTLFVRYWHEKQLFDANRWRKLLRKVLFSDMTFAEAHDRSGRVLNIACTNSRKSGAPILLNYKSTPNVVIWRYCWAKNACEYHIYGASNSP